MVSALATHRERDANGDLARQTEDLLDNVVYVVFNVPATLTSTTERIFFALLNWKHLDRDSFPIAGAQEPPTSVDERCEVFFRDDLGDSTLPAQTVIQSAWETEWAVYSRLTYDLEKQGVFTWNQFLLHGCKRPSALGLAWLPATQTDSCFYIKADGTLFDHLNLPRPIERDTRKWIKSLRAATASPSLLNPLASTYLNAWEELEPRRRVDVPTSAAASLYHLLRSYAIWGGTAFVSIPVPVLGVSDGGSAVISVCSLQPLQDVDLLRWRLLASTVFSPITASELSIRHASERARAESADRQAEAWSHDVKNFTAPIHEDLLFALREWQAPPQVQRALERAADGLLILNSAARARKLAVSSRYTALDNRRERSRVCLPRKIALPLVEGVLQFLLTRHAAVHADVFQLSWTPRWKETKIYATLGGLISTSTIKTRAAMRQAVLTNKTVIWPLAFLREVVQNIRISKPSGPPTVTVSYTVEESADALLLAVTQKQEEERPWASTSGMTPGLDLANELYGPDALGLGEIRAELAQQPIPGRSQTWQIEYGLKVTFFLR